MFEYCASAFIYILIDLFNKYPSTYFTQYTVFRVLKALWSQQTDEILYLLPATTDQHTVTYSDHHLFAFSSAVGQSLRRTAQFCLTGCWLRWHGQYPQRLHSLFWHLSRSKQNSWKLAGPSLQSLIQNLSLSLSHTHTHTHTHLFMASLSSRTVSHGTKGAKMKPQPRNGTMSCLLPSVSQNVTRVAWIQEEEKQVVPFSQRSNICAQGQENLLTALFVNKENLFADRQNK